MILTIDISCVNVRFISIIIFSEVRNVIQDFMFGIYLIK